MVETGDSPASRGPRHRVTLRRETELARRAAPDSASGAAPGRWSPAPRERASERLQRNQYVTLGRPEPTAPIADRNEQNDKTSKNAIQNRATGVCRGAGRAAGRRGAVRGGALRGAGARAGDVRGRTGREAQAQRAAAAGGSDPGHPALVHVAQVPPAHGVSDHGVHVLVQRQAPRARSVPPRGLPGGARVPRGRGVPAERVIPSF